MKKKEIAYHAKRVSLPKMSPNPDQHQLWPASLPCKFLLYHGIPEQKSELYKSENKYMSLKIVYISIEGLLPRRGEGDFESLQESKCKR